MKKLNLVYPDKSDIKYKISNFPDGQSNITILEWTERHCVLVKARLNDFKDLELIICATKALRGLGFKGIHLYTPYFLGSRSDRKFEEGSNNYLKDVICPIINSLNFECVTVMDPHSHVLEACLNNFKKEDNKRLLEFAIKEGMVQGKGLDNTILVSPDAGAAHKIYKLAEQIGYKGDIITCSKERDEDGKLTKCEWQLLDSDGQYKYDGKDKDLIIIDDICDGGGTFINMVKSLKKDYSNFLSAKSKIYLIVTHGIFSKGITELGHYFEKIYTTNSYKDCNQLELLKVKQLNLF